MRIKSGLWLLGVGLIVGGYLAVTSTLKEKLESRLSSTLGREVTIQSVHLTLPAGVYLAGISSEPDSIEQLWVRWSLLSWIKGRSGIDLEVTGPTLAIERDPGGVLTPPLPAAGKALGLWPARLRVRDGSFIFADRKVTPEVSWRVRDLRLSLKAGPRIGGHTMSAIGGLEDESGRSIGEFQLDGELLRDQAAEFTLSIRHDALAMVAPYVQPVLGAAPHRGRSTVKTKISLYQRLLILETQLTAADIVFPAEDPTVLGPSGNRLVELLKDPRGEVHLSFVVKGRLGETLDWSDMMKSALREAIRQALARSIQGVLVDAEVYQPIQEQLQRGMESLGR